MDYANNTFVVLGLARSGMSAVQWLTQQGATVYAIDDLPARRDQAQEYGAVIVDPEDIIWSDVTALIQSPGVPFRFPEPHPVTQLALDHNIPIMSDLDLLRAWAPDAQYVGITGTNGKSTTTALVGHILKEAGYDVAVGGNIGKAVLSLPKLEKNGIYVLELSSYQLDLSPNLKLDVSALLNISVDHLDRHGSMEGYVKAKTNVFDSTRESQTQILAIDDDYTRDISKKCHNLVKVSNITPLDNGVYVQDGQLIIARDGEKVVLMNLNNLDLLKGDHNHQNIAVAFAICHSLNVKAKDILEGIQSFQGLSHRQEVIRDLDHVRFINDSKATNCDAAARALETFDDIYWIVGGKSKSDGISSLLSFSPKIRHAFLIGDSAPAFAITLNGIIPFTICGDLETAVTKAYDCAFRSTTEHPIVLLSPACSSFDQFQDFEHRGECFKHVVQKLKSHTIREKIA